jgi:hypothetical protein
MEKEKYPKTAVIREIIETGRALYSPPCFRAMLDQNLSELDGKTARELVNKGRPEKVLKMLSKKFETQM